MWFLVCSLKCSLCDSKLHLPEWKQNSQRGNWNTVNDAAIQDVGSANVDQNQTIERKANWKSCVNRPDHCNIRGAEAAARNVFWVKTVKKKEFNERCKPKKKVSSSNPAWSNSSHTNTRRAKHWNINKPPSLSANHQPPHANPGVCWASPAPDDENCSVCPLNMLHTGFPGNAVKCSQRYSVCKTKRKRF